MTLATQRMTFEEYLAYDDGTDTLYELENGILIKIPPESRLNSRIAMFLVLEFAKYVSRNLICCNNVEIEVSGQLATARVPDVMVLTEEIDAMLGNGRGIITRDLPPPPLVVEVVSPGQDNYNRDYRYKRSEYAARGIQEYWIVDSIQQVVTLLEWVEGLYEERVYRDDEQVVSQILPQLQLTATAILNAGEKNR
jgi:Uma2 family endonuclease